MTPAWLNEAPPFVARPVKGGTELWGPSVEVPSVPNIGHPCDVLAKLQIIPNPVEEHITYLITSCPPVAPNRCRTPSILPNTGYSYLRGFG